MGRARRAFVVTWLLLGVAGALNHTVAEKLFGRRFDLMLPHLRYGHVMFNRNPHHAQVYSYAGSDGISHDLSELMETPAPGYQRARLAVSVMIKPDYLAELCLRAHRHGLGDLTFTVDDYDMDRDRAESRHVLHCGKNGLTQ